MSRWIKIWLVVIVVLVAAFLRFYQLDTNPPSLNWDEVAAGYNAYTIANWGQDEWGNNFPLIFRSFEDYKHPVHIYAAALSIKILGANDFAARFPSALFGVFGVVVIFFLGKELFKKFWPAFFSSLFLALSPYNIHFSRGLWETNFALVFYMLGLLLFLLAVKKHPRLLPLSFLSFGLSLFSYHSSKVVVPVTVLALFFLYIKDLIKLGKIFSLSLLIPFLLLEMIILNPQLLGLARFDQTRFPQDVVAKTNLYRSTNNLLLGTLEVAGSQYLSHFSPDYLFVRGDQNTRNSVKVFGELYKIDALFLIIGLVSLLLLRSKGALMVLLWLIISPVPSSLVTGAPTATRGLFMMGSMQLITGLGAATLVALFAKIHLKTIGIIAVFCVTAFFAKEYLSYYFTVYPKKNAIEWQYGLKQAVEYIKGKDYSQVYVTDARSQPYIFFLYYLNFRLPEFKFSVIYNADNEKRKYNLVTVFDKYHFGDWNIVDSRPLPGILYVLTPYEYSGLRNINSFDVKKIIRYPDGGDAFFLVSYN